MQTVNTLSEKDILATLATGHQYSTFILKPGPNREQPDAEAIQWAHVRYLMELRASGKLLLPLAVMEDTSVMGIGVLATNELSEARALLDQDPNIRAGRLTYEVFLAMGFPGDGLPRTRPLGQAQQ